MAKATTSSSSYVTITSSGEECENCGTYIKAGKTAYDTDYGTCCSATCAALRVLSCEEN